MLDINLTPVACWLAQDELSDEAMNDLLRRFAPNARSVLRLCGSSEENVELVVFEALQALQIEALGQYLPTLSADKAKPVSCIWPWWDAIRVVLPDGAIDWIRPVPKDDEHKKADEAQHLFQSASGQKFTYRLFRSDTPRQRRRWLCRKLKSIAERGVSMKKTVSEKQLADSGQELRAPLVDLDRKIDIKLLREVVDSRVWDDANTDATDVPEIPEAGVRKRDLATQRKRRDRAFDIICSTTQILSRAHLDERARVYLGLLRKTRDGGRKAVVTNFVGGQD